MLLLMSPFLELPCMQTDVTVSKFALTLLFTWNCVDIYIDSLSHQYVQSSVNVLSLIVHKQLIWADVLTFKLFPHSNRRVWHVSDTIRYCNSMIIITFQLWHHHEGDALTATWLLLCFTQLKKTRERSTWKRSKFMLPQACFALVKYA